MTRLNHKQKLTLARRMMTREEIKKHESPFQSKAWEKRKVAIAARVKRKILIAQK